MSVTISLTNKEADELRDLLDDIAVTTGEPDQHAMSLSVYRKITAASQRTKRRRPAAPR